MADDSFSVLKAFFERGVCQRATAPLKNGIEIAIEVRGENSPLALVKLNGQIGVENRRAVKPDMSFSIGNRTAAELASTTTEDIGEIGVAILKLMVSGDDALRVNARVHIGLFDLLRNGYLSVLPLGGTTVAKFLASKGFSSIGKIKEGISRLRD